MNILNLTQHTATTEQAQADGTVVKTAVFKHKGFVEV